MLGWPLWVAGLVAAIIVGVFRSRLAGLFVGLLCLCLASGGLLVSQPYRVILCLLRLRPSLPPVTVPPISLAAANRRAEVMAAC